MPTYSYECKKCGHVEDVFHPMTATPRVRCAVCKGPCRRLLGAGAGIIFKGSGFYETDYRRKGAAAHNGGRPAEKKEAGESKTEAKTESKSDTKKESKTSSKESA